MSDEAFQKWKADILAIRKQVAEAIATNMEGTLSKSQLKKVKAKAHNEEREYLKNNPRPKEPRKVSYPTLATVLAMGLMNDKNK